MTFAVGGSIVDVERSAPELLTYFSLLLESLRFAEDGAGVGRDGHAQAPKEKLRAPYVLTIPTGRGSEREASGESGAAASSILNITLIAMFPPLRSKVKIRNTVILIKRQKTYAESPERITLNLVPDMPSTPPEDSERVQYRSKHSSMAYGYGSIPENKSATNKEVA